MLLSEGSMDRWREYFDTSGEDIWTIIDNAIAVARAYYPHEFRQRRDGLTESMYARQPVSSQSSEEQLQGPTKGFNKTNAVVSSVYMADEAEQEDYEDDDEEEKQDGSQRNDARAASSAEDGEFAEIMPSEEDEAAAADRPEQLVPDESLDSDVQAFSDQAEMEKHLLEELRYIQGRITGNHQVSRNIVREMSVLVSRAEAFGLSGALSVLTDAMMFLQSEDEVMGLLQRIKSLNISVEALKVTTIGKSVNVYRKHSSSHVRKLAKDIVRGWKDMVDEWMKLVCPTSTSRNEDSHAVSMVTEEVGLPSPPLDEAGLLVSRTVDVSKFFNFTDDDLSAGSGRSCQTPEGVNTEGPSWLGPAKTEGRTVDESRMAHEISRMTGLQSPDQLHSASKQSTSSGEDGHNASGPKGLARVVRVVDKHRPVSVDGEAQQNKLQAGSNSGSVPKRGLTVVTSIPRADTTSNGNAGSKKKSSGDSFALRKEETIVHNVVRKSDTRAAGSSASVRGSGRANVGTIRPSLSTKPLAHPREMINDDLNKLEATKRKLQENYDMDRKAKNSRTVQKLELCDLPSAPKELKNRRGWSRK